MNADGSAETNLTVTIGRDDYAPDWQPVRDAEGPTITITTPADGDTYLRGASVTADYACSDTPAGVVECTGTLDGGAIADGDPLDTTTLGEHTFTVTATDNAGNTAARTHHFTVVRAGELAGTVTETGTGTPLEGTWVIVLQAADYGLVGGAETAADGTWSLRVDPGDYHLEFVDPALSHVIEWYDGHGYRDLAQADTASATAGATTTVDADLVDPTGAVSGTVTETGTGTPLADAVVAVLPAGVSHPLAATSTDADGHYRLTGLPPGAYLVVSALAQGTHAATFFGDTMDADAATPLMVTAGTTSSGTDIAMAPNEADPLAGSVTGTVTDDVTGDPEPGVLVGAMRASDVRFTAATFTDASGRFVLGVDGGDYYVEFFDLDTGHRFEWYDDQQDPASFADLTTVAAGSTADAALTPLEGRIAGAVTEDGTGAPLGGVWVALMGYATGQPVAGAVTAADGTYAMPAVDIGDYYEVFIDPTGAHALEFNDDAPDMGTATPVTITGGHVTTIDAALAAS